MRPEAARRCRAAIVGSYRFLVDGKLSRPFYERTALSKNKTAMLIKGRKPLQDDSVAPEEEVAMAVVA